MDVIIKPLSESILSSFLYFFDEIAFSDNPDWAHCYCVFFHHDKDEKDWLSKTRRDNRNTAITLVKSNILKGFLAFYDSQPIAWCNVNSKTVFSFNKGRNDVDNDSSGHTASIVCLLVAPEYRKKGICNKLLQYIVDYYRASEFKYLEAYPSINATQDSENYHGPLNLYIKNNFKITKTLKDYYIVKYEFNKMIS